MQILAVVGVGECPDFEQLPHATFNFFVVFAKEKHMHESLFWLIDMSLQRVDIDSDTSVQLQFLYQCCHVRIHVLQ